MAITVVGFGTRQASTQAISVPWPSGHQADDYGVLVLETSGNNAYPSAPSGWTLLNQRVDVSSTAGSRFSAFYRRATSSSESNAAVADSGNHQIGLIFALRGCITTGNAVHRSGVGSNSSTSQTTVSALTSTISNTLYAALVSHPLDTNANVFSNPSNSTLTFSDIEQTSSSVGNGGGFIILLAQHPDIGSTGNTTIAVSPNASNVKLSFLFEPEPPPITTLTADAGSFALSGQAATLSLVRRLSAESGSFTVTGQPASLLQARRISADVGSFTLNGQAASLQYSRRILADAGSFTLTGQLAFFQRVRYLVAQSGNYTVSGKESKVFYRRNSLLIG